MSPGGEGVIRKMGGGGKKTNEDGVRVYSATWNITRFTGPSISAGILSVPVIIFATVGDLIVSQKLDEVLGR